MAVARLISIGTGRVYTYAEITSLTFPALGSLDLDLLFLSSGPRLYNSFILVVVSIASCSLQIVEATEPPNFASVPILLHLL